VEIAKDWVMLTSGNLENPIDEDENGMPLPVTDFGYTWTATDLMGNASVQNDCNEWTDSSDGFQGAFGIATHVDATWTAGGMQICMFASHIYCFEQ
jgi:hypothetical protein